MKNSTVSNRREFLQSMGSMGMIAGSLKDKKINMGDANMSTKQAAPGRMIIDVHSHVPTHEKAAPDSEAKSKAVYRPDKVVKSVFSWQDYMAAMEPVSRVVVFGIKHLHAGEHTAFHYGEGDINEFTARFVRAYPEKLIGFMSVHPDAPNVVEEMERCKHDLGLKGIKLGPNYQQFDPTGPHAFKVFEAAQRMGLPVLFHQGTSPDQMAPLRFAHPLLIDQVAMAFPELRIVMAHMAHPWQIDTICVIRKHPNVYADISALFYRPWSMYQALIAATEWDVLHKLFFGTDYPVASPRETIDGTLAVNKVIEGTALPSVSEEAIQKIIYRENTLELLGIEI